jgi:NAD(P)-dependent dehydrogenase (short-subunit alcohol dehydrogenase family)
MSAKLRLTFRLLNLLTVQVMYTPFSRTEDGFEIQFGTNYVGHFLLFQLLKDILIKSSTPEFNSRVVSVSSFAHRTGPVRFDDNFDWKDEKDYDTFAAYGQAKTANIYFAAELDRRYGSEGLRATSLHPGGAYTAIGDHLGEAVKEAWKDPYVVKYMKSNEQAAATTVYAAISEEWEGKGGKYLSDCTVQGPFKKVEEGPQALYDDGHATWIYNAEQEGRLWKESLQLVGMEDS